VGGKLPLGPRLAVFAGTRIKGAVGSKGEHGPAGPTGVAGSARTAGVKGERGITGPPGSSTAIVGGVTYNRSTCHSGVERVYPGRIGAIPTITRNVPKHDDATSSECGLKCIVASQPP
jgi:hypothetical protein